MLEDTTESPFGITVLSDLVVLDGEGRGRAVFTVDNRTGHALTVTMGVTPEQPSHREWLEVAPPLSRALDAEQAVQVIVAVSVPDDAPAGDYRFRLLVADEADPDDVFAFSQWVPFRVPERELPPPPPPPRPKWIPAWIASTAAGLLGAGIVGAIALLVASRANGLDGLGVVLLGVLLAILTLWLGGAAGAFFGYRWSKQEALWLRTGVFAIVNAIAALLLFWISTAFDDGLQLAFLVIALLGNYALSAFAGAHLGQKVLDRRSKQGVSSRLAGDLMDDT